MVMFKPVQKTARPAAGGSVASPFLEVRPFAEAKAKVASGEQKDLFEEYVQRRRVAAATEGGGGALARHAVTPLGPQALQRKPQTKEEADEILKAYARGIWDVDHEIVEPVDTEEYNHANCHGYTQTGKHPEESFPSAAIGVALREGKHIAIFYRGENIAHSGIMDGNDLYHYIKGVGVVFSPNSAEKMFGYDKRYNLPDSKDEWLDENGLTADEVDSWGVPELTPEQEKLVEEAEKFLLLSNDDEMNSLYWDYKYLTGAAALAFVNESLDKMKEAGFVPPK